MELFLCVAFLFFKIMSYRFEIIWKWVNDVELFISWATATVAKWIKCLCKWNSNTMWRLPMGAQKMIRRLIQLETVAFVYIYIQSDYAPVTVRFRGRHSCLLYFLKIKCFQITLWNNTKFPSRKIIMFSYEIMLECRLETNSTATSNNLSAVSVNKHI